MDVLLDRTRDAGEGAARPAVDRVRLAALVDRERAAYAEEHPRGQALFEGADHLVGRLPMTWMAMWSGGFPLYLDRAHGNRVVDVDGNEYVDFALGDTAAMAGHSPRATVEAVTRRVVTLGGVSTMLPTVEAEWVGAELSRRFGLPSWSFTLSATDANRWALRLARLATGKPKVLTFAYCHHGSVDEAFALPGPDGVAVSRPGNVGAPVPLDLTTRVAEFNDLAGVEEQLAHGDVAAILAEPALTSIGIVLPEPGFHAGLRDLARRYGALLVIDETHTFSAGPGGATRLWGLDPDVLVVGESIGGGIPSGAYGISERVARMVHAQPEAPLADVGGVGGTPAGNELSVAAMHATLERVLTDEAFDRMADVATAFADGVRRTVEERRLPWSVTQLGARTEYRFASPAPRNGSDSAAAADACLDELLHLYLANRGVLISPFHNTALMCPETRFEDVARHSRLFAEAVGELLGHGRI
ncbi:MAG TPA: transaminase [Nocardioidaceae bacterium]|jgi:glutamate-1-semialdehyde 2,1-aminomutase